MGIQDVVAGLRGVGAFLSRPDFLVNFLANLGGALCGVLLAFWIERRRVRRNAINLYGRMLLSCRFELGYLRSFVQSTAAALKAGKAIGNSPLSIPATTAALISPLMHERAPRSLLTALVATSDLVQGDQKSLEAMERFRGAPAAKLSELEKAIADKMDKSERVVAIALERLDVELGRLRLEVPADPDGQEVSRRIVEILRE
jgi:hypothetical protein